jgi:hypothetical protein
MQRLLHRQQARPENLRVRERARAKNDMEEWLSRKK